MPRLFAIALLIPAMLSATEPDRDELRKNPRYVEATPEYATMTADALREQIKVFSRRNHAVIGFNDSAITIRLPRNDNSIYATVEFAKPAVVDKRGKAVAYEIENGIFDFDTWTNEIRLQRPSGKTPLEFDRASGTIAIKYPLALKTTRVKKSKPPANIRFDGPFIIISGDLTLPEAATFSRIEPLRAYDAKGRQLARSDYQMTSFDDDGRVIKTVAFHGDVVELQLDRVDQWANLVATYDLPPIPPHPASQQGLTQIMKMETPGGVVRVDVKP
jgi:hypothetical protein